MQTDVFVIQSLDEEEHDPNEQVKRFEIKAIEMVEGGDLKEGLQLLNEAIKIAPRIPSLYNNRAHVYQFLKKFDGR